MHHLNRGVSFGGQNVHHAVGLAMQGDGGVCLELFAVDGGEHSDVERGSAIGVDEGVVLVHHFAEVAKGSRRETYPTVSGTAWMRFNSSRLRAISRFNLFWSSLRYFS